MNFDNYTIRLLNTEDLHPYFQMVEKNRSRLENFFTGTVSRTKTLDEARKFLGEITEKARNRQYFPFVIVDNSTNHIIGFIDLKNIDWNIPKTELGCYIDEDYSGKGISAKAISTFCDYCFEEFRFKKLYLRTHHSNKAAIRIAEKCGFEKEGVIRRDYKTTSGELVDLIYYGKLSD
jgi:RimJ/RimL family protein N-acetyltransferase